MFTQNLKHNGIYHKALDKIIPGILPPIKEPDEEVHFLEIYNAFDPTSLTPEQLREIAEDDPQISGVDIGETYTLNGVTYPIPAPPIAERLEQLREEVQQAPSHISLEEKRWQNQRLKTYYKNARYALTSGIRKKSLLLILEMKDKVMTPSEREEEKRNYYRYDRAWRENERQRVEQSAPRQHRPVQEVYPFRWKEQ